MDFSTSGETTSWLIFLGIMVAACLLLAIFVVWFTVLRKSSGKKRRKNRSRRRQKNPTLAETGGLPPVRTEKKSDGTKASS